MLLKNVVKLFQFWDTVLLTVERRLTERSFIMKHAPIPEHFKATAYYKTSAYSLHAFFISNILSTNCNCQQLKQQ